MKVRTRFAPSPTGKLHVGAVRTAIFAWAWAKKNKGDFILRIEDTDKARETEGSEEHIIKSLKWLNLDWQEGPIRQSDRLDIYREWAQKLIDKGLAYADPFTPEQVDKFREESKAAKKPFLFRNYRPEKLKTPDDWYGKVPLRFKVTDIKRMNWQDEVRGKMSAGEEALDDFILIKADGYPTYNFAHIIDDYLMDISHVMRGEEFISSTPKFLSLYEALDIPVPKLATMPPILGKEGGKKMSKRDGAKDILEYKREGYLPDAMINFLASLGWNDGTEQEVFTPGEMIDKFSLTRIQKKGARFDDTKLNWLNWQHYLLLIDEDPRQALVSAGISGKKLDEFDNAYIESAAKLAASKSRNSRELSEQIEIFLTTPEYKLDDESLSKIEKDLDSGRAITLLESASTVLERSDFTPEAVETALRQTMDEQGAQPREFLNLVRWSLCDRQVSPNLFDMLSVLGKEESLKRINATIETAK